MEHRYTLEPYKGMSSRYQCPYCHHKEKKFSRYIDTETGGYLADHVGRCERVDNCGVHYKPKQYFEDNGQPFEDEKKLSKPLKATTKTEPKQASFIPAGALKGSLKGYEQNHFITYLISLFGEEKTSQLVSRYFIGTSKHWPGSTVFWQIDTKGHARTGKIMLYCPYTGKRIKEPYNHITWTHKALQLPEFSLKQCFFGEHLLIETSKPVAIVESEKTAIIASQYLPEFIWLAAGSLSNLSPARCRVLVGRSVSLFPDLNAFDKWQEKAGQLSGFNSLTVSELLESKATQAEKVQGLDLADYLVRFDWQEFLTTKAMTEQSEAKLEGSPPLTQRPAVKELISALDLQPENLQVYHKATEPKKTKCWDEEIKELEEFFRTLTLPNGPIKLNQCSTITNVHSFIKGHLETLNTYSGKRAFLPYLERLRQVRGGVSEDFSLN